jgi:acetyltransferase-like isoleucine patch superfamily enzyme
MVIISKYLRLNWNILFMNKYVIIGAGGMAAEVCSYLKDIYSQSGGAYEIEGFLDSESSTFATKVERYGFAGKFLGDPFDHEFSKSNRYICAIASPLFRKKLEEIASDFLDCFPNLIHPSSIISKTVYMGFGNVISPFCVVGPNVSIGNLNAMTSYSFLSHDCAVGSCNFLSTAGLAGNCVVGNANFFGIRSTVLPGLRVGNTNVIQAGMHIDKDIGDNATVFYKFKEKHQITTLG